jgi:hypothetical protein
MTGITVGEFLEWFGVSGSAAPTLFTMVAVAALVVFLPVWISLGRLKFVRAIGIAWSVAWGVVLTCTVFLAPFGVIKYVRAWSRAFS